MFFNLGLFGRAETKTTQTVVKVNKASEEEAEELKREVVAIKSELFVTRETLQVERCCTNSSYRIENYQAEICQNQLLCCCSSVCFS